MHVLAITPELPRPDRPGSNAPLLRQIESLRERGVRVTALDMRGVPMLKYLSTIPKMHRLLSEVDLLHGHFGFCGWLARCQLQKPLVISFMGDDLLGEPTDRGTPSWFSRQMVRANQRLAATADQVIVKSAEMANVIGHVQSHVVANGVDIDRFRPMDRDLARQKLGWDDTELVILFPGNPENPRKGFSLASEATQTASQQLRKEIRLQPMWGIKPHKVALYMNACNAMWMTSLIEGSPNVVKEAMACDRPIVGVPVGDVEHLFAEVPGCYVCPRDAQILGSTMAEVLVSTPESSGREAILRMALDLGAVADRVIDIYHRALRTQPQASESHCSQPSNLHPTGGR